MAGRNQGGTATLETPKSSKPGIAEATFPVRILHAIGVAFKQDTRYAMSSLLIRSKEGKGGAKADAIEIVGTDGRRMMIVRHDTDLYSGDVNVIVPGDIVRAALRIASKADSEEPMATVRQNKNSFSLTVHMPSGANVSSWKTDGDSLPFPPYEGVIPDFSLYGVSEIGVSPQRMAKTLLVVEKIIGADHTAKLYMPSSSDRPVGVEATDGGAISVMAVVMPSNIAEWTKTDEANNEEDDEQDDLFADWRENPIDELDLSDAVIAKLNMAFGKDGEAGTLGALMDFLTTPGKSATDINGITAANAEKLDLAVDTYFKEEGISRPAKQATAEEKDRDQAQEHLLAYLQQRFIYVGVPAEKHQDAKLGEKMDEAVLAKVLTPDQAKSVKKTMHSPSLTAADVTGWHNKLKALKDDDFRDAAKSVGVEITPKSKKTTLPS